MTLCPIALAVGCKKCPLFSICPVKQSLGNYQPEGEAAGEKTSAVEDK